MNIPTIIDSEMLASLMQQGQRLKLIDVRSPAEFETAHIAGSYNVPLDQLPEHREELRDALRSPVVLVCQSGNRARQAEQQLKEAQFEHVHILDGGVNAWLSGKKDVIRGQQRWGLERQVRGLAGSLVVVGIVGSLFWKPLLLLSAAIGVGLSYSALSNTCGMAFLLSKLPYNQGATCDVREVVSRIASNEA